MAPPDSTAKGSRLRAGRRRDGTVAELRVPQDHELALIGANLSGLELRVFLAIRFAERAFPDQADKLHAIPLPILECAVDSDRRSVQRALLSLTTRHMIRVVKGGGRSRPNAYTTLPPGGWWVSRFHGAAKGGDDATHSSDAKGGNEPAPFPVMGDNAAALSGRDDSGKGACGTAVSGGERAGQMVNKGRAVPIRVRDTNKQVQAPERPSLTLGLSPPASTGPRGARTMVPRSAEPTRDEMTEAAYEEHGGAVVIRQWEALTGRPATTTERRLAADWVASFTTIDEDEMAEIVERVYDERARRGQAPKRLAYIGRILTDQHGARSRGLFGDVLPHPTQARITCPACGGGAIPLTDGFGSCLKCKYVWDRTSRTNSEGTRS